MAQIKQSTFCPLVKGDCLGLGCSWYTLIRGIHPQTGKEVDEWGCAIALLPALLINTARESCQTGAAVESFRNEMVRQNEISRDTIVDILKAVPGSTGKATAIDIGLAQGKGEAK